MKLPKQSEPILRGVNRGTVQAHVAAIYASACPGGTFECACSGRTKCCKKGQTCHCNGVLPVCS